MRRQPLAAISIGECSSRYQAWKSSTLSGGGSSATDITNGACSVQAAAHGSSVSIER
jgi:hypothetical protein